MFDERRAQRAVKFFESLKHTTGKFHGQPFELLDWQLPIVRDVYGTLKENRTRQYKYAYLEIPKKNGKTELVAGAALYATFADGEKNGQVFSCAAEKGQASIAFDVAYDMIGQVPALKKRTKPNLSQKLITDKVSGTEYKAISAEAYSKHGLNLSTCIFDELHAQPNRDLWDVMTFGAGDARQQPLWWVITTAGDDPDRVSIGWEQHEYAVRLINGDLVDPTWYAVIYNYDGDDIYNEANWKKANPSLGHTIEIDTVREAAAKAKEKPADEKLFRWLRLNQWLTTKLTTWLDLDLFDNTQADWRRDDLKGETCYIGMDLSSTTDLSALALVFPPQAKHADWRVVWDAFIPEDNMKDRVKKDKVPYDKWVAAGWVTATEGNVIDYNFIKARIVDYKTTYNVKEVCSDPALATMLLQQLTEEGLDCVPVPQTFVTLTDPMNQLEVLLKAGELTHENNLVAKWCFGNTSIAKQGSGLIKYVKETKGKTVVRTKRIDLMAALVIAMVRARFFEGGVSKYESEDLIVF